MINGEFYLINTGLSGKLRNMGGFTSPLTRSCEVKEPRLMTKFDTRESLPRVFGKKISILPVLRGGYVLGEFDLYQDFPEIPSDIKRVTSAKIPDYLSRSTFMTSARSQRDQCYEHHGDSG